MLKKHTKHSKNSIAIFVCTLFVLAVAVLGAYALLGSSRATQVNTTFSVDSYGAVGDGSTDDTAAIQRALNAAAGKGPVVLSAKTYHCLDQLKIPSNTQLTGAGSQSVLKFDWIGKSPSGLSPYLQNSGGQNGDTNISLTNFAITGGNTSGLPSGTTADAGSDGLASMVRIINTSNTSINHMTFHNAPSNSINVWGGSNTGITDNTMDHQGRSGIAFFWSNTSPTKNVTISNNTISYLGDDAIAVAGDNLHTPNTTGQLAQNITVTNNTISSWLTDPNGKNQGRGIAILGVTNATVSGNTISHIAESGILIRGSTVPGSVNPQTSQPWVSSDVTVSNNTISYIGQNTTTALAASRKYWKMDGIEIDSGKNLLIKDNQVSNITGIPIDVVGGCDATCRINPIASTAPTGSTPPATTKPPVDGGQSVSPTQTGSSAKPDSGTMSVYNGQTSSDDSGVFGNGIVRGDATFVSPATAGVKSVVYYIDGRLVHVSTSFPDKWTFDTKSLKNGEHSLRVVTIENDGTSTTQTRALVVKNTSSKTLFVVPLILLILASVAGLLFKNRWMQRIIGRGAVSQATVLTATEPPQSFILTVPHPAKPGTVVRPD